MKDASWMEFSILIRDIDALRKSDTSRSIISNNHRKNLTAQHWKGPVQSPAGVSPFLCHRNVTVYFPPISEQHSSLNTIVLPFIFMFKLLRGRNLEAY